MNSARLRTLTTFAVPLMVVFSTPSFADHGSCPCKSGAALEKADALNVFEPAQRAIVFWDGEKETIILSTDVRVAGISRPNLISEFIPLPSRPAVAGRPVEIFRRLAELDP